uniref:Proteasome subunit alpha type n=1 Tax=Anabas testudineus TaxID=64144 RepID=A0A7N6FFU5_ANATE
MAERGYSFSLTTFSPSGKLVQIEYALAAVAAGAPSVGIKASNGVVLATEKKQKSILYDEQSVHKVEPITKHIGMFLSWVLVRRARKLAQQYFLVYQEPIPTGQLVQRVASVMQEYTQSGWVFTDMLQMPTSPLFVDFMDKMSSVRVLIWNLSCCLLQWSASIWSVVADSWVG